MKNLGTVIGISSSIFLLSFAIFAWTSPPGAPPTCPVGEPGCETPLHTGTAGQSKTGGLLLNTGGASTGLIVEHGNVGIGTLTPSVKMEVIGGIKINSFSLSKPNCNESTRGMMWSITESNEGDEVIYCFRNSAGEYHWATIGKALSGTLGQPFTSPQQVKDFGYSDGLYYFKTAQMSEPRLLLVNSNLADNRPWVKVFSSPYGGTATLNEININLPFKGILVRRSTGDLLGYGYFNNEQQYQTRTSNAVMDFGEKAGYRVFLGGAGSHGIYNTSQAPCNWANSSGSVGAGFNGSSCGSFPNNILWGTGTSGATYSNMSGTWEHWIWWD